MMHASRGRKRGVSRSSRTLAGGCDGRIGSQRAFCAWTNEPVRTAKSCGPDTPTLVPSRREMIAPTRGARKPGSPGRARRTPLKPSRREGRMFGQSPGDCRLLFLLQAGHGCGLHPAFPAPSVDFEGARMMHNSGTMCRGTANMCVDVSLILGCHAPLPACAKASARPRVQGRAIALAEAACGASSIPETSAIEPKGRGVLDRPVEPGDDSSQELAERCSWRDWIASLPPSLFELRRTSRSQ